MSLSTTVSRFINRLLSVGADPADPPDRRLLKRLFVGLLWGVVFFDILALPLLAAQGVPLQLAATLTLTILVFLGMLASLHRRPAQFAISVHILCAYVMLNISMTALFLGGMNTGLWVLVLGLIVPILALLMLGPGADKFWLGAFILANGAVALSSNWMPARYLISVPDLDRSAMSAVNLALVGVVSFISLRYFIRQRDEFQRKSDDLLRNILPGEIAERLKDSSAFIAEHFDRASVLFADVVAFTPMSSQMSPTELVTLLNEVFSEFDRLVERHGLEKIKTIGDCYMVAAGVPQPRADHAQALTQLALEMQTLVANRDFQGRPLRFRIGLNSGPLIAGVIGRRKFIYDLWGDAVNTASRMESHGAGGAIQITEATHELIKDDFICEAHETINVKGKGEMKVWYVLDQKA